MKRIMVILIGFVIMSALHFEALAAIPTPGKPPTKLPIGSMEESLAWIVSNTNDLPGIHFYVAIMYTNAVGIRKEPYMNGTLDGGLTSLEEYMDVITASGLEILDHVRADIYAPTTTMWFYSRVSFNLPTGFTFNSIFSVTPLGTLSQVTSNSFRVLTLPFGYRVPVHVAGLQEFRVEVGKPTQYSYTWKQQGDPLYTNWPGIKQELTQSNYVVLSSSYCQRTNHVRFYLTVKDRTYVYTQFGEMLSPPQLEINKMGDLNVIAPRGADVTVETSTDQLQWIPISDEARKRIVVGKEPARYYRAFIR